MVCLVESLVDFLEEAEVEPAVTENLTEQRFESLGNLQSLNYTDT